MFAGGPPCARVGLCTGAKALLNARHAAALHVP